MRGHRRRIAGVAVLACLLLPATAEARSLKAIWGPVTLPNGHSAFPTYHKLGVKALQLQLSWAATAPHKPGNPTDPGDPAYRWPDSIGKAVTQAQRYGIKLALQVKQTPHWANGGRSRAWAPNKPSDYADFVQAASRKYPSIRYWEIWGEPTRPGNFKPMPANSKKGPRRYARVLNAAYGALKAASPRNVVIGGMTWTAGLVVPADFVKWMKLPDGKPPRLDMYGHNPFSTRYPKLKRKPYVRGLRDFSDLDTLHGELRHVYRHAHMQAPKLWLSEFTIPSSHGSRAFNYWVSRKEQARWVSDVYRIAARTSYIAALGWYSLLDSGDGRHAITTGLMTHSLQHKPAFEAYQRAP
jgi:hypothetical protein